jgi:hypothetical protein
MSKTIFLVLGAYALVVLTLAVAGPSGGVACAEDGETPTYVGADSCKACHFKQHKSWNKTTMSKAYSVLLPGIATEKKKATGLDPEKDYCKDAKCLECHTTAYGTESGFPAVVEGKDWTDAEKARAELNKGVTCEACHGPGSLYGPFKKKNKEYKRAEIVALGAATPVTEKNCMPCHEKRCPTMGDDYKFDYEALKNSDKIHDHKKLKKPH